MTDKKYQAVVIGAGPGGYVAAIRLGQSGIKTAIIEKENVGGVCLNVGCIPSKALIHAAATFHHAKDASTMGIEISGVKANMKKTQAWKDSVVGKLTGGVRQLLKHNKVDLIQGEAKFDNANQLLIDGKTRIQADKIIIATGSRPIELKDMPFDGKQVVSSTGALSFKEVPKSLTLIGGGVIGLEIGQMYAHLGSKVTVVEFMSQILPGTDKDLVQVLARDLKKLGVEVLTNTKAVSLKKTKQGVELTLDKKGKSIKHKSEKVLIAVGRRPNFEALGLEKVGVKLDQRGHVVVNDKMQSNLPHIYAIGDIAGAPYLAHKGSKEGLVAAGVIAGQPDAMDVVAMPAVIYTKPEIASVGLNAEQAKEQGYTITTGKFPFAANGRALSTNDANGFVKVIADKKSGVVLGMHMVGPEVSNLIAEACLALEMGATLEDIALTVHPHPTLSEAIMETMDVALGQPIHIGG